MTQQAGKPERLAALRSRAVARLSVPSAPARVPQDPSAALGVLYQLASSPSTAPDALALLHELQVHQVEVEMQEEELRRSRVELEATLDRQLQLYHHAPVAYFTLDPQGMVSELNMTAARLLGVERDAISGRPLDHFLSPASARVLLEMRGRANVPAEAEAAESAKLQLRGPRNGETRRVHASVRPDPAGEGHLVALFAIAGVATA